MTTLNLVNSALPQYTMTLPISGISAKFRPFVVKEEKVLLLALQSANYNQINDAIKNVVHACTNGYLDTRKLCSADSEYAFLQIRSKSVGEEVKPNVKCSKCSTEIGVNIKLDQITPKQVPQETQANPNIKITDDVTIVLKYPSIHDVDHTKNEVEIAFELAKKCIDSVILKDQVHQSKDINPKELSDFVDNLLPDQFAQIVEFFKTIPQLYYEFKYTCPSCKENVTLRLDSISDFFL